MSEYNPSDLTNRVLIYVNDGFVSALKNHENIYLFYALNETETTSDYTDILSETDRINNFTKRYYTGRSEYNEVSIYSTGPKLTMVPTELISHNKFRLQIQFTTSAISEYGTWIVLYYSTVPKYTSSSLILSEDYNIAYILYFKSLKDLNNNGLGLRMTSDNQNYIELDLSSYTINSGLYIVGNDISTTSGGTPIPNSGRGFYGTLPLSEHKHYLDNSLIDNDTVVASPLAYINFINDKIISKYNNVRSSTIIKDTYTSQYMLAESGIYPTDTIVFDKEHRPRYITSGNTTSNSKSVYKYKNLNNSTYELSNYSSYIDRNNTVLNNLTLEDTNSNKLGLISNYLYNINSSEEDLIVGENKIRLLGKILNRESNHQMRSTMDDKVNTLVIDNPTTPYDRCIKYINLPDNFQFTKGYIESSSSSFKLINADRQGQYIVEDRSTSEDTDKYQDLPGAMNIEGTYDNSTDSCHGVLLVNENSVLDGSTGERVDPDFINQIMINNSGKIFIRVIK